MPYVDGPGPPPLPREDEGPAVFGVWLLPEEGALIHAVSRGAHKITAIKPKGTASAQQAAALVRKPDPETGELRPVTRLTIYDWVRDGVRGRKLLMIRRVVRPNTRPVLHIRLTDLRKFAEYAGYTIVRADPTERRQYQQLLARG